MNHDTMNRELTVSDIIGSPLHLTLKVNVNPEGQVSCTLQDDLGRLIGDAVRSATWELGSDLTPVVTLKLSGMRVEIHQESSNG